MCSRLTCLPLRQLEHSATPPKENSLVGQLSHWYVDDDAYCPASQTSQYVEPYSLPSGTLAAGQNSQSPVVE